VEQILIADDEAMAAARKAKGQHPAP